MSEFSLRTLDIFLNILSVRRRGVTLNRHFSCQEEEQSVSVIFSLLPPQTQISFYLHFTSILSYFSPLFLSFLPTLVSLSTSPFPPLSPLSESRCISRLLSLQSQNNREKNINMEMSQWGYHSGWRQAATSPHPHTHTNTQTLPRRSFIHDLIFFLSV